MSMLETEIDLDGLLKQVSRAQLLSIVDSERRKHALWYGSVSAGKTVASLIAFLIAVRRSPQRGLIVIIGKTISTIYANLFTLLQDREIFGARIASQVSYTPGATSATVLGREVLLVGANDAKAVGNIQGKTIALAYVDEAALLPESFWAMLITRLRVPGARLLATMNPASRNHWMYRDWILKAKDKNLVSFHFTMKDNPNLEASYVEDMKRMYSGVFYDRMIRGEWTNAAGAVFPMWDPARHVIEWAKAPKIYRNIGIGIDFGTSNPTAAEMLALTDKRRLLLLDEFRHVPSENQGTPRLAPSTQAQNYRKWLASSHHPTQLAVPAPEFQVLDPAAAHFQEELFKLGITTWHGDNDVIAGIATLSRLLDNDLMQVTDHCPGFISEASEYAWSEKATAEGRDEVVKENDHSLDGARYIAHTARASYEFELAA